MVVVCFFECAHLMSGVMLPFMCSYQSAVPSLNCFDRHLESKKKKDLFYYLIFFFSSHLSRNDLTYRVVTVPLEQVHNYTFKCST